MKLRVACLSGEPIFSQRIQLTQRKLLIDQLNSSDPEKSLDGLLIMNEVGGLGFNMVGANHIIFLGSMHSAAYEEQTIGSIASLNYLICRQNLS